MNRFYNGFTVVNNTLKKVEMFFGSLCLAVLFVVMIVNAALRYLFSSGLNFSDELNGFLFVWLGFFSAAYIMANKGHLRVTALVEIFPPVVQYIISVLLNIVMLYMIAIYIGPLDKLLKTLPISNVMRLPLRYVYVILPVCFGLMAFHIIYNIADDTRTFLISCKASSDACKIESDTLKDAETELTQETEKPNAVPASEAFVQTAPMQEAASSSESGLSESRAETSTESDFLSENKKLPVYFK